MKNCRHCNCIITHGTLKDQCTICYARIRKFGSTQPKEWNKSCQICQKKFISHRTRKYCDPCRVELKLRINWSNARKRKGVSLDIPKKNKGKNGTGTISTNGYRYITCPGHPNAGKAGRIGEHRFVMSKILNRKLKKNENVHHINGIKTDNRPSNLELWHLGQPPGQRLEDKLDWAISLLEEYNFNVKPN